MRNDSVENSFEPSLDPLDTGNLENLRNGYETVFGEELEVDQVSRYFSKMLEQENPDQSRIKNFLNGFEREPGDEFLKGIYNGVIDYSEEEEYLPFNIS